MGRRTTIRLAVAGAALVLATGGLAAAPSFAADSATMFLVQGLPDELVDVSIDGTSVDKNVAATKVAGPFKVKAGRHEVEVSSDGKTITSAMVTLGPGSSWDVVAHLPAPSKSKPVITAYKNDLSAVSKDKSSLTVAHTAAVPPADIRVNGKVLFQNVANGESLNLVVPVATYTVDIVPTGKTKPVFLGPLNLTTQGGALNRVFAIGDPEQNAMRVAVHIVEVDTATSSKKPGKVNSGTGGQAAGLGASGSGTGLQVDLVR